MSTERFHHPLFSFFPPGWPILDAQFWGHRSLPQDAGWCPRVPLREAGSPGSGSLLNVLSMQISTSSEIATARGHVVTLGWEGKELWLEHLLCARKNDDHNHGSSDNVSITDLVPYRYSFIQSFHQHCEGCTVRNPILQMRNLRPREVK